MTRTLPWLKNTSTTAPAQQATSVVTPRAKRPRNIELSPDNDSVNGNKVPGDRTPVVQARAGSTSPPPEPPSESFMEESLDRDDKFRMVEDEFLDIARQFTQHLHAAEYQRMRKAARFQNAATINSISRPVTTKMPNETCRKVAGIERSKKQEKVIRSLLCKQIPESRSDEDSDNAGNPWVGTSLYGLMESPRRSTTSLFKLPKANPTTKSAAGFREPRRPRELQRSPSDSPLSNNFNLPTEKNGSETDSDDVGDDLDAPIQPPNPPTSTRAIPFSATSQLFVVQHTETFRLKSVDYAIKGDLQAATGSIGIQDSSTESKLRAKRRRQTRIGKGEPQKSGFDAIIPTFL